MKNLSVYCIGHKGYATWLSYFYNLTIYTNFEDIEKADLVMFTGGSDVSPLYYGMKKNPKSYCDEKRDDFESSIFNKAKELKKPMIGICRGSQFLTAMNGGLLIQDVTSHAGQMHKIDMKSSLNGVEYDITTKITSTHHQMMYPFNLDKDDYNIIAKSSENRSLHYEFEDSSKQELHKDFVEVEMVYYPKTRSLGIQGHPEMMSINDESMPLFSNIVNLINQMYV